METKWPNGTEAIRQVNQSDLVDNLRRGGRGKKISPHPEGTFKRGNRLGRCDWKQKNELCGRLKRRKVGTPPKPKKASSLKQSPIAERGWAIESRTNWSGVKAVSPKRKDGRPTRTRSVHG